MRLAGFEHLAPNSLAEACAALSEYREKASIIAGGTDILVRMKYGLIGPRYLVDIKRVGEIAAIKTDGDGLRIGSQVTLTDLQWSSAVRELAPVLAEAAAAVGATQLQNMGTIGGNLCLDTRCWYYQQTPAWRRARAECLKMGGEVCHMAKGSKRCYAIYSGDTAAALLALDANVRIVSSRGERRVPLADFFVDDGKSPTILERDELLAEIIVPPQAAAQVSTYIKFRRRGAIDFPIVGVGAAVALDGGVCRHVRIAVTGAGSAPFVAGEAQSTLLGNTISEPLIEEAAEAAYRRAKPVSHMEVSAAYRKRLVRVLVKDALSRLASPL